MSLPTTIAPGSPGHIGDHEEIHTILADVEIADVWVVARFLAGTLASRGAAGRAGSAFLATDQGANGALSLDNGSGWNDLWRHMPGAIFSYLTQGTPAGNLNQWHVPLAIVSKTTAQTISSTALSSTTQVTWDDETGANNANNEGDTLHSIASQTARLKATRDGFWNVGGYIRWASNTSGRRRVEIEKNGSTTLGVIEDTATTGRDHQILGGMLVELELGDYVRIQVSQNSGGNLDVLAASRAWFHFVSDE